MLFASSRIKRIGFAGIVILFGAITGFVLWSGNGMSGRPALGPKDGGDARLLSIQPLPEEDGPMCNIVPASATSSLFAELSQQQEESQPAGAQEARPSEAAKAAAAKRPPVRTIQDPNPVFSAIALDLAHDEVVMQDENTYSLMVYNRMENTPRSARMSEPKRVIHGANTNLDLNCGLYVDPGNGEIYSINNDTLSLLTVFSRDAKGDVKPVRVLKQQGSLYGIAVDEEKQEMFLLTQGGSIGVYKKSAKDDDKPLRFVEGNQTRMANSHGIALDPKDGLMFVGNWGSSHLNEPPAQRDIPWGDGRRYGGGGGNGRTIVGSGKFEPASITVYRMDAMGDVAPLRVIQGSKTQLNWPTSIAVDPEHKELFVANDTGDSVSVYNLDADGDAAPIRVLKGPKSLIKNPSGIVFDAKHDELWVSNFGNHTSTVYKRAAAGDATPARTIRSAPLEVPAPVLSNPHVVIYNPNRDELLVAT